VKVIRVNPTTVRRNPIILAADLQPGDTIELEDLGREHVIQGPYRSARGIRFIDMYGNSVMLNAGERVRLLSRENPHCATVRRLKMARNPPDEVFGHPLTGREVYISMPDGRHLSGHVHAVFSNGRAAVSLGSGSFKRLSPKLSQLTVAGAQRAHPHARYDLGTEQHGKRGGKSRVPTKKRKKKRAAPKRCR